MNAPLPMNLIPTNIAAMDTELDIVALARSGGMALAAMVSHAEQLQRDGHAQAASNLYALWLAHHEDPRKHLVWFNHGSLLQQLGQSAQAQQAYEQALALSPDFAQARINLGLVLEKQGHTAQAIAAWAHLTGQRYAKDPVDTDMLTAALNHIGRVHENNRDYRQALEALEHSLLINPKQAGVIQHWVHIRQKACEWPVYKPLPGISKNEMIMATSPLAMLALTDDPLLQLLSAHAFVARTYGLKEERLCKVKQYHHPKKRIGFASGDLREHAVGFLLPTMLQGIDRELYEVYAYDFTMDDGSEHRKKLLGMFDHVRLVHTLTDRQAAERILEDEIDVMVDLHGLSAGARPGIFALHPAPRQGTYLGFIGSTGMPWFDFVITDRHALPPEYTEYFMEKPLYVEGSFIPLTPPDEKLPVVTRADVGLPEDAFVMGAFGNVYKITPEMFGVWMKLLKEIPDSVLWLIDDNPTTTENLKNHARLANVDLSKIKFTARTGHSEFNARLKLCDVFLDTFPYNCGSTSNDVIRAKIPLATQYGRTMVSRMGLSISKSCGSNNLISVNADEYFEKIVNFKINKIGKFNYSKPAAGFKLSF
ncbi:O-linked N-acetylglucosamine transferase, SPINDLY family protein [Limnohabitans sp. 63ED37-2]|uniref:O-linked N-acetylglucosamine transferase, SPINDLY family protein n=1 Tax=Limnohabitans sp. 63ED37-2 TaxID=1678128 RepID=UPI000706C7F0|nr:tetratricopeptide repeat protein [Limnohabitans sp. 63ED37-2]ALK88981.1 Photosystem I assembly protein Ycf3 [Limnohabitans sp. 63ED37-2]